MTRYVYLLWRHGEYGPVDTVATLDRSAVATLAQRFDEVDAQMLAEMLSRSDASLVAGYPNQDSDGHKLCAGWGGVHLHVCPLEE